MYNGLASRAFYTNTEIRKTMLLKYAWIKIAPIHAMLPKINESYGNVRSFGSIGYVMI